MFDEWNFNNQLFLIERMICVKINWRQVSGNEDNGVGMTGFADAWEEFIAYKCNDDGR